MPRDEEIDDEWDETEEEFDHESATVPCSHCGGEIFEDAIRCPICGEYITTDTRVWSGKPLWYILLALAGIIAVLAALTPW